MLFVCVVVLFELFDLRVCGGCCEVAKRLLDLFDYCYFVCCFLLCLLLTGMVGNMFC